MDIAWAPAPTPRRELRTVRRHPDHDHDARPGTPRPIPTFTQLSRSVASPGTPAPVRRRAGGDDPLGGAAVPEAIETVLRRRRGTGAPLPVPLAQDMSAGFGMDLSGVRVHTDPEAARISRQLHAEAFTRGQDIYFGTGAYRPESTSGRELLAHELAHVVQQHQAGPAGHGPHDVIGRADDPSERQADELAARVVQRRPSAAPPAPQGPGTGTDLRSAGSAWDQGLIQRRPALFRSGNAAGPRIDNVRDKDIPSDADGNVEPGNGGVSTFAIAKNEKPWWKYPAADADPASLSIRNDHGKHWSWEPSGKMSRPLYIAALQATNSDWVKTWS